MPKFRKKPVVIDAIQWDGLQRTAEQFFGLNAYEERWRYNTDIGALGDSILILTLEGEMLCRPGDWIVRGVKGEYYPVRPDIFAATYEPAEEYAL